MFGTHCRSLGGPHSRATPVNVEDRNPFVNIPQRVNESEDLKFWAVLAGSRLERKPISEPVDRSEVNRTAWIILQLLTELHYVIVDRTGDGISIFVAPNFVQQLCARDDAIRIVNE